MTSGERLYQGRFSGTFELIQPKDVTPEGFKGLCVDDAEARLSRFVREVTEPVRITSPAVVAEYLLAEVYTPFEDFDQEELWVHLLTAKNRITHDVMVYRGTVDTTIVRSAELLKEAVRVNAPALILSHLHPSGDPTPSPEDIHLTRMALQAAKLLDLLILDHIVIGKDRWVSLKERDCFTED